MASGVHHKSTSKSGCPVVHAARQVAVSLPDPAPPNWQCRVMAKSDYDQWAEAYATANAEGFFNSWYEKPAMLRLLGDVSGKRVLDAGCGSGPTSVALTERGADVSGFDLSAAMIEIARRSLPETDLRVHDLAQPLPWKDATFDNVVASLVLHYLEDWSGPLSEIHRVLAPGGRLLVSVNHPGAFPIVYGSGVLRDHGVHRGLRFCGHDRGPHLLPSPLECHGGIFCRGRLRDCRNPRAASRSCHPRRGVASGPAARGKVHRLPLLRPGGTLSTAAPHSCDYCFLCDLWGYCGC